MADTPKVLKFKPHPELGDMIGGAMLDELSALKQDFTRSAEEAEELAQIAARYRQKPPSTTPSAQTVSTPTPEPGEF